MFQWASDQFDKISQTVAPPPTDAAGRFSYSVSRMDENAAMGCIAEIDPVQTVVNQSKGWFPIHMACQYSMLRLIRLLMNQPGANIQQPDYSGCTPLHHACMSSQRGTGLEVVKILLKEYSADPCAKNSQGQTPYDVATLDSIRQYLLPIQLQRETQYALDNGGQGLPPGIDLGGLKINRSNMAPPPQFGGSGVAAPPPAGGVSPMTTAPGQSRYPQTPGMAPAFGSPIASAGGAPPSTNSAHSAEQQAQQPIPAAQPIARAPASMPGRNNLNSSARTASAGGSRYSRSGGSSLAVYSKYKADGFHSSSSDVGLQQKYGHVGARAGSAVTPPPSSGNAPLSGNSISSTSGPNPFSGAANLGGVSRYAAYGRTTAPAPVSSPMYAGTGYGNPGAGIATQPAPTFFTPQVNNSVTTAQPEPENSSSTFMPPPPYSETTTTGTTQTPSGAGVNSPFDKQHSDAPVSASNLFESPPKLATTMEATSTILETKEEQPSGKLGDVGSNEDTSGDWVETTDPTSGKTYYFNSKTNETSWTKPNSSTVVEESATTAQHNVDGDNDWSETIDPSSGKTYYYNNKTGETSWEKPSSNTSNDTDNTTSATAHNEASQDSSWVEATDPASGNIYYYNSETGETSWDRPSELDSEKTSQSPENKASATNVERDANTSGNITDEHKEEEQTKDEDPPKESSQEGTEISAVVEEKVSDSMEKETTSIVTEDKKLAGTENPENNVIVEETKVDESNSDALLDGWVETKDPSSGNIYYYNTTTNETSWDRPSAKTTINDSNEKTEPNVTEEVDTNNLPENWEEIQDPSTGRNYYYNTETQETSWDKPMVSATEPLATNDNTSSSNEVDDWVETIDPSSGKAYFYNPKTGETSWEKPSTMNENQQIDANVGQQTESSNENTFSQPHDTSTTEEQNKDKSISSPLEQSHKRSQSADDLFASPPGESASDATAGASTKIDNPDFSSPAAATPGSAFTSESTHSTAEELFGSTPTVSKPNEVQKSETAEDLFGANEANAIDGTPSETDEGVMTDIPLTPSHNKSLNKLPSTTNTAATNTAGTNSTDTAAPATTSTNNDLFAAIGMPPPPFQSRR